MAFSKVKVGGLADDSVTAANIDDDGTGYTVGNLTNSGTLQQTGQATFGSGGTNWTLPTARGTDKYVLQINGTTGAADWAESLTAPEISGHNFDVSGSTDDGEINAYEAPYEYTGTTNATTTISALSSTTGLLAGQYISGAGIPADTTIVSVDSGASTMVISNAATASASGVALKIQKTPGEKNGGKVTLTGANFGATIGEITVAITNSAGVVIANASYLSGLSGGNTIVAEWTGTEGSYSTDLTSSYTGSIYFKMTKSGLSSNVHNTNTTLTSDPAVTALSGSSQTGGDISTDPTSSSLGVYGSGRIAGGGQDSNTQALLNFDRGGGTDIEDSSNIGDDGHKVIATNATIKSSPFGDGKSAFYFSGANNNHLNVPYSNDFNFGDISGTTNDFTVEFWVNLSTFADEAQGFGRRMLSTRPGSFTKGWEFRTTATNNVINVNFHASTNIELSISNNTTNTWMHLAVVRQGNVYTVYKDGSARSTVTSSNNITATDLPLKVGTLTTTQGEFQGYIDEIRIVKGLAVYTGNFTVPTSRLSTTWTANPYGGSNTVANSTAANTKLLIHSDRYDDASNFHYPVTYVNNEFLTTNTLGSAWGGSHFYFDSANTEYVKVENPAGELFKVPASTPFCLEGWFKRNGSQSQHAGIFGLNDDNNACLMLMFDASNQVRLLINQAGGSPQAADEVAATTISDGTWYHIAAVRQTDNNIKLYVDGVLRGTSDDTSSQRSGEFKMAGADPYFSVGYRQYTDTGFDGSVQDVRFVIGSQVYSDAFTRPNGPLTTTGGSYSDNTNVDTSITNGHCKLLLRGNQGSFDDSSVSDHAITPTGTFHTYNHGGIAPVMAWPANKKATGSSGFQFNGTTSDHLELTSNNTILEHNGQTTGSFDCWVYHEFSDTSSFPSSNSYKPCLFSKGGGYIYLFLDTDYKLKFKIYGQSGDYDTGYVLNSYQWYHVLCAWDTDRLHIYIDGYFRRNGSYAYTIDNAHSDTATSNYNTVSFGGHSHSSAMSWKGYFDQIRITNNNPLVTSGDPLYQTLNTGTAWASHANGTQYFTPPTTVYGVYGAVNPDVGTITLTATGDGDFTWSEVAGGTAMPGSLAVGSTTHSGSGNSRTHTATITGRLPSNASTTYTNGTRGDIATNNILLKVQHDTDATKAVTLNGDTGMSITQKATGRPVLFNARRYMGKGTSGRDITEFGFSPDLVWAKDRDTSGDHHNIVDSVRGTAGGRLNSNRDVAQGATTSFGGMLSDGFITGSAAGYFDTNDAAFIAWGWKAGGAPTTDQASQVRTPTSGALIKDGSFVTTTDYWPTSNIYPKRQSVSTTGGFSITQYVGDGNSSRTVPHGLGSAPHWVVIKNLDGTANWSGWHTGLSSNCVIKFNSSNGEDNTADNVAPSGDHLITLGSNNATINSSGVNYIMYAWKAVAGVSAFGTHSGQISSVSGNIVGQGGYCGFQPRFVLIKRKDGIASWALFDSLRGGTKYIEVESSNAEGTSSGIEVTFQSNGFTTGSHNMVGTSSQNYISMAFA